ncbi:MAG: universal stress protein [Rhodanobacteraceae bacterium]
MQDVLVYARSLEQPWGRAVQYGANLARRLDAALTGACVSPSPLYTAPPYSSLELVAAIFENARAMEAAGQAARSPFIHWGRELGIPNVSWLVAQGHLPEALARFGAWNDLLVLDLDGEAPWGSPHDVASLVMSSHLPCIVVPASSPCDAALDCIALAWNGAPEAVRAIHAALPLLQSAKRVVLLCGERRDTFVDISWKPPFDMVAHLDRHGVVAQSQELDANDDCAGQALLAAASHLHADLLVMGCYGRTRFSEWALGGATRDVLHDAKLPVFMRH